MTQSATDFNRYCKACRYSLRGVVSGRCPECGRGFDPNDPRTTSAHPHGDFWMGLSVVARQMMFVTGALAGMAVVSSAWGWAPMHMPGALVWLAMLSSLPLILGMLIIVAWPRVPLRWSHRVVAPLLVAIMVSVPFTQWPMRVMFALHRPWLEPIADRVKAGEIMPGRHRVGILFFRKVYLRQNGNVGFQLNGNDGGGTFLVRDEPDSTTLWYNCGIEAEFGDNWYLVDED